MIGRALALLLIAGSPALAHDSWIARGLKNSAGELCCGAGDCFVVQARWAGGAYEVAGTGERVPEAEAMPSQDSDFWRCRRPDGSRRCFFAPRPGT